MLHFQRIRRVVSLRRISNHSEYLLRPSIRRTLVIGLVGSVASGKSTVAALFRQLGAKGVDADAVAHRVIDRPAVRRAVARAFGPAVLADGRVDRRALADCAFRSADGVRRLNAIVHPHVARELRARIRRTRGVLVIDAPLLQEAGADAWCDAVVFVEASRRVREARAAGRGWSPAELRRRERFQWSARRKRARADYVVRNGGSLAAAGRQVRKIYQELVRSREV